MTTLNGSFKSGLSMPTVSYRRGIEGSGVIGSSSSPSICFCFFLRCCCAYNRTRSRNSSPGVLLGDGGGRLGDVLMNVSSVDDEVLVGDEEDLVGETFLGDSDISGGMTDDAVAADAAAVVVVTVMAVLADDDDDDDDDG